MSLSYLASEMTELWKASTGMEWYAYWYAILVRMHSGNGLRVGQPKSHLRTRVFEPGVDITWVCLILWDQHSFVFCRLEALHIRTSV